MFFDILAVFVVSLISSLFLCSTSVHGLPSSSSSSSSATFHYIHNSPSADLSSSLRFLKHRPVPTVDHDSTEDLFQILMDGSNENDDSSLSSIDLFNEPSEVYPDSSSLSLKFLPRKFLSLQEQHQEKRSSSSIPHFNFNAASKRFANLAKVNNAVDESELNESIRLSSSLKNLVQKNPLARMWLTMLLQKLMQEQSMPYIFKYGRRRK